MSVKVIKPPRSPITGGTIIAAPLSHNCGFLLSSCFCFSFFSLYRLHAPFFPSSGISLTWTC